MIAFVYRSAAVAARLVLFILAASPLRAQQTPESSMGLDPGSVEYRAVTSPPVAESPKVYSDLPDLEKPDEPKKDEPKKDKPKKEAKKEGPHRYFDPIRWGGPEGKDFKLQLGGDNRVRVESRHDYDGILGTPDDDNPVFVRSRINADLIWCEVVRAYAEILDGRVWHEDENYNQDTHLNVQQLFVELGKPELTSWSLRLGRQELEFGRDKRLVESSNWNNLRRTFDGARAIMRSKEVDADLFLVNTTTFNRVRRGVRVTERARTQEDEYFYGAYTTLRSWDPHTIETYFLGLSNTDDHTRSENRRLGSSDRYTIGSAIYGPLWKDEECGTLGYGLEGAFQFGHRSDDEIRAYMLHGDVWYEWVHPWKPRVSVLGNIGSGDDDPNDGVTNTFNQLYGSSHSPYGIIDAVRLQNLRELALVGNVKPTDKMKLQLEFHTYWLDSKTDAWYDAGGRRLGRDTSGDSDRRIGQEISAVLGYQWSKCFATEIGAARFFSGPFARRSGSGSGANFFYAQTIFTF